MPATVTRLRIAGFKSFAEPTTIDILPGLTGIVGPNGCGKSNVVEALRWAMGETSARNLRGGEMDEVIFAGSALRPARSIAEVVVTLDEAAGLAPAPLQGEYELQVSRQIERGAGSTYRVNGRETRARDIQTIFADIASGARSSAMVSQGRVSSLVDARPEDRRAVLEEAAGITGLHARRHEAELRLRAAQTNLARVADLRAALETRHAALTDQAQAARAYRLAADECGAAEQALLGVLLGRAARARSETARAAAAAASALTAAGQAALHAQTTEQAAEAALSRDAAEAALAIASLERARAAATAAAADGRRAVEALAACEARLEENQRDHAAMRREAEAAETAHLTLTCEADALEQRLAAFPGLHATATATREAASADAIRQAERSQARRLADAETTAARSQAEEAARRAAVTAAALLQSQADTPSAQLINRAADRAEQAASSATAARAALTRSEQNRRKAEEAVADLLREAASLNEAVLRATDRGAAALQRRDRLAVECRETSQRHAAAAATRPDPAERTRASAAIDLARSALATASATFEAAERRRAESAEVRDLAAAHALQAASLARDAAAALEQASAERDRHAQLQVTLAAEQARLASEGVATADLAAASDAVALHASALDAAREQATAAEHDRESALGEIGVARSALATLDAERVAAAAELGALSAIAGDEAGDSLLASLNVPEALEAAAASALGSALTASLDPDTERHWRDLGPLSAEAVLPTPAKPLLTLFEAPPSLSRALSQIGLVEDAVHGSSLQSLLLPGQALVAADGSLFRWDGLVMGASDTKAEAERLRARRRVAQCRTELAAADAQAPAIKQALAEVAAKRDAADASLSEARSAIQRHDAALIAARATALSLAARDAQARARVEAIVAERARVDAALANAAEREATARSRAAAVTEAPAVAKAAKDASLQADEAVAAERDAREILRTNETILATAETAFRQLTARDNEAAALLATLEPALSRLTDELSQAAIEVAAATTECDRLRAEQVDQRARSAALVSEHDEACRREVADTEAHTACLTEIDQARASNAELDRRSRGAETRIAVLEPEAELTAAAEIRANARLEAALVASASLHQDAGALENATSALTDAQRWLADLEARAEQDRARQDTLAVAIPAATARRDAAAERTAELQVRLTDTRHVQATLLQRCPALADISHDALQALATAEAAHVAASQRLQARQTSLSIGRDERRTAESALSAARDIAQRADLLATQAIATAIDIEARTHETAPGLAPVENPTAGAEADAKRRLAFAVRTRDEIGPVNLLAEREVVEAGERLAALAREADELDEAVARLRGSIGHLNREGRERLSASFVQIDAQFRSLFGRMFDGGRAHLALVGSDDPLEAGLEIYAQPPGKKLATLSLLSGGEQALTALSLIFAAFRCNPAPVCVLDEVDAPLDDANVERFCRLVSDMARETGTRFLVVTHHQLTMANMDRLYGVTMQERGVSRLISVDLGTAESFVK